MTNDDVFLSWAMKARSAFVTWPIAAFMVALGACSTGCDSAVIYARTTGSTGGNDSTVCATAQDCPVPADECILAICEEKRCSTRFVAAGTLTANQIPGDCRQAQCNGNGASVPVNDDTDVPDDGKPCTVDTCPADMCVHTPESIGVSCGSAMHCDGLGSCVSATATWAKRFGGADNQLFSAIDLDATGNPGMVGWYRNDIDFGGGLLPQPIINDGFAVKFDTAGTFGWNKAFPSPTEVVPSSIQFDDAGNSVVLGSFRQTVDLGGGVLNATSPNNLFAAQYTANGTHVWSKRFGETGGQGYFLQGDVDAAGNVYVAAYYSAGAVDFGCGSLPPAGDYDALFAKLDSNGQCIWSKRFGDAGFQQASAIAVDKMGHVIIAGILGGTANFGGGPVTSTGGQDVFVAKLDSAGNHIWSKHFGDTKDQLGMNLAVTDDGDIAVSGWYEGTIDFGGNPMTSAGINDGFVAKLDANGQYLWSQRFGGAIDDAVKSVAFDKGGNVVVTGFFRNTIDLGVGPLVSAGGTDVVVAKYASADGKLLWGNRFGGPTDDLGVGVAVDAMGYAFVVGNFQATIDFGLGPMVATNGYDAFVAKFPP